MLENFLRGDFGVTLEFKYRKLFSNIDWVNFQEIVFVGSRFSSLPGRRYWRYVVMILKRLFVLLALGNVVGFI